MLQRTMLGALYLGALIMLSPLANAVPPGACSTHAGLLRDACFADKDDDYLVHRADCVYVTSEDDELECRAEAREERNEKREECKDVYDARLELCDLVGEERYLAEFDPLAFADPDDIGGTVTPNPYWPLTAGHTHVITAETDEPGVREVTVVTATAEVREVGGIPCRVMRDLVFEEVDDGGSFEYEALEVTQDWYAQLATDAGPGLMGDVVYCGENTYEVEDGLIDNTDGSFAHLKDRALAGVLVRAMPDEGEGDRQEMATDEAEDFVRYEDLSASPDPEWLDGLEDPCDGNCLQTYEVNPRDPGQAEYKYYLPGTGFVLAVKLEDGEPTGELEAVSCVVGGLGELDEDECGIGDLDTFKEAFCDWEEAGAEWVPDAFCDD